VGGSEKESLWERHVPILIIDNESSIGIIVMPWERSGKDTSESMRRYSEEDSKLCAVTGNREGKWSVLCRHDRNGAA
jgi:hypothetical protein